ncbi:PLP-dependent cysteine synthase family protein [Natronorubrum sp. FCH18a]|uniref:PLP-dependent cysteine synthase family protein n=1 Tax=Natronorubrum sp. FCH18a TaxID=3447018 RepID=UPI003F5184FA
MRKNPGSDQDRGCGTPAEVFGGPRHPESTAVSPATSPYDVDDPILSLIGNTSMIEYPDAVNDNLYVKLEKENPTGSMKDRIALGMTLEMYETGDIDRNDLIVEASSGNTAGGVSLVANRLGHDCVITTPETTSRQKIGYVKSLGAELIECPSVDSDSADHYRNQADAIADNRGGVFLDQYHNQLNPEVHAKWTGPELYQQLEDVTHVVCPMGTGGTLSGIGKYLKNQNPTVEIIGVDAINSNISTAFYDNDPVSYETQIEGLGKGSKTPTMWFEYVDDVFDVSDDVAIRWAKKSAKENGVLIGPSSGAALKIAHSIASDNPGSVVALIACDGGEQYFDVLASVEQPSP